MNTKTTDDPGQHVPGSPINQNLIGFGGKDKDFTGQFQICYESFYSPKTMAMVEHETGIMRPNICRYVAFLKKNGKIRLIKTDTCPITKCKAGFYQTSPAVDPGNYVTTSIAAPIRLSIPTPDPYASKPKPKKQVYSFNLFNSNIDYE